MRHIVVAVVLAGLSALCLDVAAPIHVSDGVHPTAVQRPAPLPGLSRRHVARLPIVRAPRVPVRFHHPHRRRGIHRPLRAPRQLPAVGHRTGAGVTAPATRPRQTLSLATTIEIPRLGIHAPVREGTVVGGYLPIAPGYTVTHFVYSAALGAPGNAVIYGHDDIDGNIFAYLGTLQPGDRVYFSRGGRRYRYVVTGSEIVPPSDVSVLDPTPGATLTMISCTPFDVDTQRIVVRATLVP